MNEETVRWSAHLSDNYQLQAADALIKKLRTQLGEANSYIDELENDLAQGIDYKQLKEENKRLKVENKELQTQVATAKEVVNKITARYSEDLKTLNEAEVVQSIRDRYNEKIAYLETDLSRVTKQRDAAVQQLLKLHDSN